MVLDTSAGTSGPQVIHRQYYKPYGEVATQSGSSRTSIGYTGQRLDQDSGLMFYNARFYDPVLSHFVSGDPVAPNKGDPKSRNKYSYVLNNPLGYTDPSGYQPICPDGACTSEEKEAADKAAIIRELHDDYGIDVVEDCKGQTYSDGVTVGDCQDFTYDDLALLLQALKYDLLLTTGWSPAEFKKRMGTDTEHIRLMNRTLSYPGLSVVYGHVAPIGSSKDLNLNLIVGSNGIRITHPRAGVNDSRVAGVPPDQRLGLLIKATFVHELAHVWDRQNSRGLTKTWRNNVNTAEERAQNERPGRPLPGPVSSYGSRNDGEGFAESVTQAVFPRYGDNSNLIWTSEARKLFR